MPDCYVTSRGRITIPKAIRSHFGLRPGDRINLRLTSEGQVLFEPATVDLLTLRGSLAKRGIRLSTKQMNRSIRSRTVEE